MTHQVTVLSSDLGHLQMRITEDKKFLISCRCGRSRSETEEYQVETNRLEDLWEVLTTEDGSFFSVGDITIARGRSNSMTLLALDHFAVILGAESADFLKEWLGVTALRHKLARFVIIPG